MITHGADKIDCNQHVEMTIERMQQRYEQLVRRRNRQYHQAETVGILTYKNRPEQQRMVHRLAAAGTSK